MTATLVRNLSEATFTGTVEAGPGLTLVDFWAAWCGPCRIVAPVVEELARDFAGRVTIAKVDVDANPALAERFGVRSIPTMLFFRDGRVVGTLVGVAPKHVLAERLEALAVAAPRR